MLKNWLRVGRCKEVGVEAYYTEGGKVISLAGRTVPDGRRAFPLF